MYGRRSIPIFVEQLNPETGIPSQNTPPTTAAIERSSLKSIPIFSQIRYMLNRRTVPQALFIKGSPLELRYQKQSTFSDRVNTEIRLIDLPAKYRKQ